MISLDVFCPYERILAKCLKYASTIDDLKGSMLSLVFENGVKTPVYKVEEGVQLDNALYVSQQKRLEFLRASIMKAELTIVLPNSAVLTRHIIVDNSLLTDDVPNKYLVINGERSYNGKTCIYEGKNADRLFYPECYFTENAKIHFIPGEPSSEVPALIRPVYNYTDPIVSAGNDTWYIYGPSNALFDYKGLKIMQFAVQSENQRIGILTKNIDESPQHFMDDLSPDSDNPLLMKSAWSYYLSDGVQEQRFVPGCRMLGLNGEYLEPEVALAMARIFIQTELDDFNELSSTAMDVTINPATRCVKLSCTVHDGRTYLSDKALAYHEKYLRESEKFDKYLDGVTCFGGFLVYTKNGVPFVLGGKQLSELIHSSDHRTATFSYASALMMMYSFEGSIRQWFLTMKDFVENNSDGWDIADTVCKLPHSFNDGKVISTATKVKVSDLHTIYGCSDAIMTARIEKDYKKFEGSIAICGYADGASTNWKYFVVAVWKSHVFVVDSLDDMYHEGQDITAVCDASDQYSFWTLSFDWDSPEKAGGVSSLGENVVPAGHIADKIGGVYV